MAIIDGMLKGLDVGGVASGLAGVATILIVLLFFVAIGAVSIYFFMQYRKHNQFQFVIWGKDGFGQIRETTDIGGIFVDPKTKNKRLFMKKSNVGLSPDNVPYLQRGNKKVVYLYQTGLKNFQYLKPNISDNPGVTISVGEEDVNWAINAYERQKKVFQNSVWMQVAPYLALGFVSFVILILFYQFFKRFDVLADLASALQTASQNILEASKGTTIIK